MTAIFLHFTGVWSNCCQFDDDGRFTDDEIVFSERSLSEEFGPMMCQIAIKTKAKAKGRTLDGVFRTLGRKSTCIYVHLLKYSTIFIVLIIHGATSS